MTYEEAVEFFEDQYKEDDKSLFEISQMIPADSPTYQRLCAELRIGQEAIQALKEGMFTGVEDAFDEGYAEGFADAEELEKERVSNAQG